MSPASPGCGRAAGTPLVLWHASQLRMPCCAALPSHGSLIHVLIRPCMRRRVKLHGEEARRRCAPHPTCKPSALQCQISPSSTGAHAWGMPRHHGWPCSRSAVLCEKGVCSAAHAGPGWRPPGAAALRMTCDRPQRRLSAPQHPEEAHVQKAASVCQRRPRQRKLHRGQAAQPAWSSHLPPARMHACEYASGRRLSSRTT